MSSVKWHCHGSVGPEAVEAVALHQAIAGKEIADEQIQTRKIKMAALVSLILAG